MKQNPNLIQKIFSRVSILNNKTLLILGVPVALFGIISGWIVFHEHIEKNAAGVKEQNRLKEESIDKNFKDASKQIGSKNLKIRESGVEAMGRIDASFSDKTRWDIMEKLASVIRADSPATKRNKNRIKPAPIPVTAKKALEIIKFHNYNKPIKYEFLDLKKVNLYHGDLQAAKFSRVDLRDSQLYMTGLKEAELRESNLSRAYLRASDLSNTHLNNADLTEADLMGADLIKADLSGAKLNGANLREANLSGAIFDDKQIKKACNWKMATDDEGRIQRLKEDNSSEPETEPDCEKFDF